ncbi:MAG: hypothetical protein RLZZ630_325, partial [Bacteroidota bacterium]
MKVTPTKGLFINLLTLLVVFATATVGFAQTGQLSLQNCEAIAANRIEFDVYYKNTSANPVQFNANVIRINYNAAIMPATGQFTTLAWGYVGGSAFPNSWPPVNSPTFTVSNGTNPRFLTTSTGTGIYLNGTGCAAPTIPVGDSVKLGRFFFQINGGTFVSGQATGLAFNTGANVIGYINCASVSSSFMPSKTSYCSLTIPSACSVNATTSSTPASCSGSSDGSASVTATGSSPFTYLWSNGETTSSISGLAPGQYSVTVTATGGCTTTSSVTVGSNGTTTSNTTSDSACGSYTWAVNGQTYTQSGSYTSINGCATEILSLTVTPSTSSTTTETAVGSYTWSVNGQTYTQSGFYTSVNGCATDTLNLTISGCTQTPQPTIACYETATWDSVNCQWNITGTQPTQPTLACYETATFNSNTCQWDVTGTQPTQPTLACYETATFNTTTCQWDVTGTPSPAIVTTASACDSYTWSSDGNTYTQSGTFSYSANCQDYTLSLIITPTVVTNTVDTACQSYIWSANGVTYTQSGTYSYVADPNNSPCSVAVLNLVINQPSPVSILHSATNFNSGQSFVTGDINGQNGWSTYDPTFTTGGGSFATITTSAPSGLSGDQAVSFLSGTGATSSPRYAWGPNYGSAFSAASAVGANTVVAQTKLYVPSGSTSTARQGMVTFDVTGAKILTGFYVQQNTGTVYLLANYNNAGTIANFTFNTNIAIVKDTWVEFTTTWNQATGRMEVFWAGNGFYVDGAGAGSVADETDFYNTRNASSVASTVYFDELSIQFVNPNGVSTDTTTASACDSYTWAVTGQTYSQTGYYSYTDNQCNSDVLNLTITPGTSNTTTESACSSYTWSVNGQAYTQSGSYTSVSGCATEILSLTITPQPQQPTLACYETATYNTTTCQWDVTGTQPAQPSIACYETATFNNNTCQWDVTGTQPTAPTISCYETATFNTTTCQWDVTGTQPTQPSIACYETATFNNNTCQWDVTGTQPTQPSIACYESATFNSNTCQWDVTGTQPTQPSIACYETATFNSNNCQWDVSGTQPTQPSIACYETATFNSNTCQWDVTGTQPTQPTLACFETATFNSNTCQWDVTGTQPTQPSIACYETTTFNSNTCQWDVTGTQPTQPTTACYETATFNGTTCQWDVTGTPNPPVVTTTSACSSYVWLADGQTYTASGTYNYSANCQDYELNLTITPLVSYYVDADGDSYGAGAATTSCTPLSGYVANNTDCNDNSSTVYPSATETCNGIDDDCNSWVDDGTAGPISGNGIRCVPASSGTATFSVQAVQGTTYAWTVPTGLSIVSGQGTNSIVVSWTNSAIQAGITGSISVVPTNLSGTVSPSCISVDINYAKPVTPGSISSPNKVCPGDVINLSTTSVTRASGYAWTLPTAMRMLSVSTGNVV